MPACHSDDSLRGLGDDCDPSEADSIERHIEGCPTCKARLKAIADLSSTSGRPIADLLLKYDDGLPKVLGFEIEEELGRGNWGTVYLARKEGQSRRLALKLMSRSAFPSDRRRWNREAQAVSTVRHPNVVTLYEYGEEGRWLFLAFEYIPGGSLKDRLAGPLPPRTAAELLETTARAVARIHSEGILHLDLKPGNILLDGQPDAPWDQVVPKVGDFGLSLSREDLATPETSLDGPRGTPSYMAPEQTAPHRGKIGPAADVYALGAVLYATLTGRPPFQGATHLETMEMVRREAPVPPRQWNPRIPRDLETIALKALAKEPPHRYPTAENMADDLRRWLDGRAIRARRATLAERAVRSCRRNPVVAALCLALALTTITAFGVVLQALRWERLARAAAEQNLDVAAVVINQLGDLALGTYHGKHPLDEEGLTNTFDLLRRQVTTSRSLWDRHPEILQMLGWLNGARAGRLCQNGRFEAARELLRERSTLLRWALEAKPPDIGLIGDYSDSLIQTAQSEIDAGRPEEALSLYDQSASVLLSHPEVVPGTRNFHLFWWYSVLTLSDAYFRLPYSPSRDVSLDALTRGLMAHLNAAIRTGVIDANRPDVRMFRACVLADRGAWTEAEEAVRGISWLDFGSWIGSPESRHEAAEIGIEAWATRLVRRWIEDEAKQGTIVESPALEKEADILLALLKSNNIDGRLPCRASVRIYETLALYSSSQRAGARLDRAERAACLQRALADRLLQTFPEDPAAHRFLSETLMQESKNAWKRDDLETVRSKYVESIAALRRVLELDPNDARARSNLTDHTKRLVALPSP